MEHMDWQEREVISAKGKAYFILFCEELLLLFKAKHSLVITRESRLKFWKAVEEADCFFADFLQLSQALTTLVKDTMHTLNNSMQVLMREKGKFDKEKLEQQWLDKACFV